MKAMKVMKVMKAPRGTTKKPAGKTPGTLKKPATRAYRDAWHDECHPEVEREHVIVVRHRPGGWKCSVPQLIVLVFPVCCDTAPYPLAQDRGLP